MLHSPSVPRWPHIPNDGTVSYSRCRKLGVWLPRHGMIGNGQPGLDACYSMFPRCGIAASVHVPDHPCIWPKSSVSVVELRRGKSNVESCRAATISSLVVRR
ncbi:hypothetical protein CI102_14099 [Trichoderma harzianum]|nr:hypothetical protein CI102_14099 [Trichoderma harzianum]